MVAGQVSGRTKQCVGCGHDWPIDEVPTLVIDTGLLGPAAADSLEQEHLFELQDTGWDLRERRDEETIWHCPECDEEG